jgi:hypothetical protein
MIHRLCIVCGSQFQAVRYAKMIDMAAAGPKAAAV